MKDVFAQNGLVRVHARRSDDLPGPSLPLVIAPGMSETAEDYDDVVAALAPRGAVAISFRGRGNSEAPASGYSIDDHVADLEAVVARCGLSRFALFGFSAGVPYSVAFTLKHPRLVHCLVIGDSLRSGMQSRRNGQSVSSWRHGGADSAKSGWRSRRSKASKETPSRQATGSRSRNWPCRSRSSTEIEAGGLSFRRSLYVATSRYFGTARSSDFRDLGTTCERRMPNRFMECSVTF